jgi:hypothetical protein
LGSELFPALTHCAMLLTAAPTGHLSCIRHISHVLTRNWLSSVDSRRLLTAPSNVGCRSDLRTRTETLEGPWVPRARHVRFEQDSVRGGAPRFFLAYRERARDSPSAR